MENVLFLTGKDKIVKLISFCGKQSGDYAACFKNVVHFLVASVYKMNL